MENRKWRDYSRRVLLGAAKPVHTMTPSSTVRRMVNLTAVAVADAGAEREKQRVLG